MYVLLQFTFEQDQYYKLWRAKRLVTFAWQQCRQISTVYDGTADGLAEWNRR